MRWQRLWRISKRLSPTKEMAGRSCFWAARHFKKMQRDGLSGSILKLLFLGVLDAMAIWAGIVLVGDARYLLVALLLIGVLLVNIIFLSRRAYPWRYILPGLIFFLAMTVYPFVYTVRIAFTNFGAGHFLTREQVVDMLEARDYLPADHAIYHFQAFQNEAGDIKLILTAADGAALLAIEDRLHLADLSAPEFVDEDGDGAIDHFKGYHRLTRGEVARSLPQLRDMQFVDGNYRIKLASLSAFRSYMRRYQYDREAGVIVDLVTGTVYRPYEGRFISPVGEHLIPGFKADIGWQNFYDMIHNPLVTGPFFRVFRWTFLFAGVSVVTTFALGLFLALVMNDPTLQLKKIYRSMLILPWAIPGFISILIWAGMFNTEVGIVNRLLMSVGLERIPWFQEPFWAMAALVLVNLWLGFPYMMTISLGALQSIPDELYEAATVDGATRGQRFHQITLPLLLVSLAPLLVGAFAFNFNNFALIFLLTGGGPHVPGEVGVAGATDILISYTFQLAFGGGRGIQYGFAAAVSIIIAIIIGTISLINFKLAGTFEEVKMDV